VVDFTHVLWNSQFIRDTTSRLCLIKLRSLRRGSRLLFIFFRSTLVVWHSAHRDNRINRTWEWRGRSTELIVNRHLTYCLQIVAENPPTHQGHYQVASFGWEHRKIIIISRTSLSPKKIGPKNEELIDFDLFFWQWPWPDPPPPGTPLGGSWDSLRMWCKGVRHPSWLDNLTWQAVTCQVIWRGAGGEDDKTTWQAQLVKLTCQVRQVPLVPKTQVQDPGFSGEGFTRRILSGCAASGGALAPQPPRANRSTPEFIQNFPKNPFFSCVRVQPVSVSAKPKCWKSELSRLNPWVAQNAKNGFLGKFWPSEKISSRASLTQILN